MDDTRRLSFSVSGLVTFLFIPVLYLHHSTHILLLYPPSQARKDAKNVAS